MTAFWSVPREWPGETVFIIGGGPSVLGADLEALRGRRVIVINSSVYAVPWADILFFGDWRWWNEPENKAAVASFCRPRRDHLAHGAGTRVLVCRKTNPPGLALERNSLMQKWTSLTAATNLAAHLIGPGGTIVWLGADGQGGAGWPHPSPQAASLGARRRPLRQPPRRSRDHRPSLRAMGITAYNARPAASMPICCR